MYGLGKAPAGSSVAGLQMIPEPLCAGGESRLQRSRCCGKGFIDSVFIGKDGDAAFGMHIAPPRMDAEKEVGTMVISRFRSLD